MPTIAQMKQQVDRIWSESFHAALAETLVVQLRQHALAGVRAALETALEEEVLAYQQTCWLAALAQLPSSAFQRSGTYARRVLTSYGYIPDLRVPKLRGGNRERPWHILTRYQIAMPIVLDQALYLYTLGLSVRDLQEAVYVLFGHVLSRDAINRVTLAAQSPMQRWRERPISDTPPILIVDGVWVQILAPTGQTWIDRSGHERKEMRGVERVVLAVMGVWEDGRHEILHYEATDAESTESWSAVLAALKRRGLDPEAVRMVVSDGSTGLPAALTQELPTAQQQRCVVHKVRGLERAFCYRDPPTLDPTTQEPLTFEAARRLRRQQVSRDAHAIFEAPTRAEAQQRLVQFQATWGTLEPEVVRKLTQEIATSFTFYQFDASLHPLVRSTNLLERFFREFRTKADEIGAFPNELTCLTVFHLIVTRDHAKHDRGNTAKTG
ncbi:MAG: IS256 family transposase [Terriglobales bacterium]